MRLLRALATRASGHSRGPAAALLALCALCAGCGWSDEERRSFLNDCLTNARIDDDALRNRICSCWLDRSSELYSYDELQSSDAVIRADFTRIVQECARDNGVEAYLPPLE